MTDPDADMETGPSLADTNSPLLSTKLSEHDSGTTKDRLHEVREEAELRRYAEDFFVHWMMDAIRRAKPFVVGEAIAQNPNLFRVTDLDHAILDVISRWDFSQVPEQGSHVAR